MAETRDPTATVQSMFAAFGAGDLDALLATVHPDSHWTYYGANPTPTRAEFHGEAEVRRFFQRILDRLEMAAFDTDEFVVQGDTVVVFGGEAGKVRATGQPFRNVWTQKYVVKDDRIVEMVEYNIQVEPRG
jgi:ketosteroid isomerase-like protein